MFFVTVTEGRFQTVVAHGLHFRVGRLKEYVLCCRD